MKSSIQLFDISTPEVRRQALSWFDKNGWKYSVDLWLSWKIVSFVGNTINNIFVNAKEIEAQKQAAIDIIRAGKENNVDELEITISKKAGIGLEGKVEGVPIEFIVGHSGKMKLKVKYKD